MIKNLESGIKLARPDERVEEELEGPRIGDDAVLLHQAEEGTDLLELAGPAHDPEQVGVHARRVFAEMRERARPREELELSRRVEGPVGEDVAEERAGDRDGVRVEVAGAGLREGLGDGGDEEGVGQLVRPRRGWLLGGSERMAMMMMHWDEWRWR